MTDEGTLCQLGGIELRILGALMEKARTTPDIYPLTLNSLVTACNQKTSRDPVTDYDEEELLHALEGLRNKGLVMRVDMAGSRVAKFRENLSLQWSLSPQEYALLALLFLRGPQTPGQLRGRSERLFEFAEISQVQDWLNRMQDREEEPVRLVESLPRLPGTKEVRYGHVFGEELPSDKIESSPGEPASLGPSKSPGGPPQSDGTGSSSMEARLSTLEERVNNLESLINDLTR